MTKKQSLKALELLRELNILTATTNADIDGYWMVKVPHALLIGIDKLVCEVRDAEAKKKQAAEKRIKIPF